MRRGFLRSFIYAVGSVWLYYSVVVIILGALALLAFAAALAKIFL